MSFEPDEVADVHGGQESVASNPGQVSVNHLVFYSCYPFFLIVAVAVVVVGGILLLVGLLSQALPAWIGMVVLILGLGIVIGRSYINSLIMANGDTCPAIVLYPDENLIAVYADMSTTGLSFVPAIKIIRVPLSKSPLGPFKAKDRLTVVCTFMGDDDSEAWDDVSPIPTVCATKSEATVERSLGTISDEHWKMVEEDLRDLPNKKRPRLQFIRR